MIETQKLKRSRETRPERTRNSTTGTGILIVRKKHIITTNDGGSIEVTRVAAIRGDSCEIRMFAIIDLGNLVFVGLNSLFYQVGARNMAYENRVREGRAKRVTLAFLDALVFAVQ